MHLRAWPLRRLRAPLTGVARWLLPIALASGTLALTKRAGAEPAGASTLSVGDPVYREYLDRRYGSDHSRGETVQAWKTAAVLSTVGTPMLLGTAVMFDFLVVGAAKRDAERAYENYESAGRTGVQSRTDAAWRTFEDERSSAQTLGTLRTAAYATVGVAAVVTVALWVLRPTRPGHGSFALATRPLPHGLHAKNRWSGAESVIVGTF